MRKTGRNKPDLVTFGIRIERYYKINIEATFNEESGEWSWEEIVLTPGKLDYSKIVSGLVSLKYRDDEMMAIINNHLKDQSNEDHMAEFLVMQSWRDEAKRIAKEAIQFAIDKGWEEPDYE